MASDGTQGNGHSGKYGEIVALYGGISLSADARHVAFISKASNLVAGDTNDNWDVFVNDRQNGATTRVSISTDGAQANGWSWSPLISADGHWVAFSSRASNLVAGDTNGRTDVFIHDRESSQTVRVSVADDGAQANGDCGGAALSANGQLVAFESWASNLVPDDTNRREDVFITHNPLAR
jgi:Tol biopolymer transport system component